MYTDFCRRKIDKPKPPYTFIYPSYVHRWTYISWWATQTDSWFVLCLKRPLVAQFCDPRLRRFNLVSFDMRGGHGKTSGDKVPSHYGQDEAAEDIVKLMVCPWISRNFFVLSWHSRMPLNYLPVILLRCPQEPPLPLSSQYPTPIMYCLCFWYLTFALK